MQSLKNWISLGFLAITTSCAGLNYPVETDPQDAARAQALPTAAAAEATGRPKPPVLLSVGSETIEADLESASLAPETSRAAASTQPWFEFTKLAREARARGDFELVRENLDQAALKLSNRRGAIAQRRTVFGMRARLARELAVRDRLAESDELAEQLFAEVAADPALGNAALADLAFDVAARRTAAAEENGNPDPQLPLLRIALGALEVESPSPLRMNRAYEISQVASDEGDHDFARHAIDRAVIDAQRVAPGNKDQIASLLIYKTQIALDQDDLVAAEASAVAANRIFEEIDAPTPNRAFAEATLAEAIARTGDEDRARAILSAARNRSEENPRLPNYVHRFVIGASARVERSLGNAEEARAQYQRALALAPTAFAQDEDLIDDLTAELEALSAEAF